MSFSIRRIMVDRDNNTRNQKDKLKFNLLLILWDTMISNFNVQYVIMIRN